jgi:hypothetical protein
MSRRFAILVGSLALAALVAPTFARADQNTLTADIPFTFVTAGRTFNPGTYTLKVGEDLMSVEVVPPSGTPAVELVVTRLWEPPMEPTQGHLVFDKVGNTYTLSEMFIPGEEGYLLHVTKEAHAHQTVPLRKKAS